MSDTVPEPSAVLHALRASTADLLKGLTEHRWADGELAEPSLCDGWTRGHLLTHLARNADATAGLLSGVLRGEEIPLYPGGPEARNADIEAGAHRPVAEVLSDVTEATERLDRVLGAVAEAGRWDVPAGDGHTVADRVRFRLVEIELHRVDLGGDYTPDRWPPLLVSSLLPEVAGGVSDRTPAALRLVVDEAESVVPSLAGREWTIGSREPIEVRGPDWALLAWLAGRGQAVADRLGPDLPELAPWR